MKKFIQNKLKEQKGLTLIELLAVIVILAIIAAIAIPAIGNIIENSRYGAAKSDFQNAIAAANLYIAEENKDPKTLADLGTYLEDQGTLKSDVAFTREDDVLNIGGGFTINGEEETLPARSNAELGDLSSGAFKDLVQAQ